MNAAAYAYASLDRQDLDRPLAEIRQYAAVRGWEVVAIYADVASGPRHGRPEFRRLLADAASGKFHAVIVPALDHLGRSVRQLTDTLEQVRRSGVALVSITDDIDTADPAGAQIFHVMAALGRFERALAGDRIRSGLRHARALGKPLGRPRAAARPDQVIALRAAGASYRAIARRLKISIALAHRLARQPSLDGRG